MLLFAQSLDLLVPDRHHQGDGAGA